MEHVESKIAESRPETLSYKSILYVPLEINLEVEISSKTTAAYFEPIFIVLAGPFTSVATIMSPLLPRVSYPVRPLDLVIVQG